MIKILLGKYYKHISHFHILMIIKMKTNLLFPINIITIFEFECCLASSNHVVRWLKVSLLVMS